MRFLIITMTLLGTLLSQFAMAGQVSELSNDVKALGFKLSSFEGQWYLGVPMLEAPLYIASLDDGTKGVFTKIESQKISDREVLVVVEDSVGEHAEYRIDLDSYQMQFTNRVQNEPAKTTMGWYIRFSGLGRALQVEVQSAANRHLRYLIQKYDHEKQELVLSDRATHEIKTVPLRIPITLDVHAIAGSILILQSQIGCPIVSTNMGGLIDQLNAPSVSISLSMYLESETNLTTPDGVGTFNAPEGYGSAVVGTMQQAIDSLLLKHSNCAMAKSK
jgi:hypothetical protein